MKNSSILKIFLFSLLLISKTSFSNENGLPIQKWQNAGYLTFGIPVKPDKIDPTLSLNAHTKFSLPIIFETLTSISYEQELQPSLAKSWEIEDEGESVVLKIKPHHFFSDNTEVTAKDVFNSIERVCNKNSKVYEELRGLKNCQERARGENVKLGIEILDKYKIKFHINCSAGTFLFQLSSPNLAITKLENTKLIGSGPYIVQEEAENYLVLGKNTYASNEIYPKNNGIVLFYSDTNHFAYYMSNFKPDGFLMYRTQDLPKIVTVNYSIEKITPNITEVLVLNNQRFPFNHEILRKAIANKIYNGFDQSCILGSHKAYGLIPYGTGGSISNFSPVKLDEIDQKDVFKSIPELSKKRFTITIHQLNDLKNECESKLISDVGKNFNIDFKFKYHKKYSSLEPLYLNHKLDGFLELYVFSNRDAYTVLQFFSKNGENNENIQNNKIDKMLSEAIKETTSHGKFQAYKKINQFIQDKNLIVPIFYMDHSNIISKCISGAEDGFLFNSFLNLPKIKKINGCKLA